MGLSAEPPDEVVYGHLLLRALLLTRLLLGPWWRKALLLVGHLLAPLLLGRLLLGCRKLRVAALRGGR